MNTKDDPRKLVRQDAIDAKMRLDWPALSGYFCIYVSILPMQIATCREVRELLLLLFDSAIVTRRSLTLGGAHMPLLR